MHSRFVQLTTVMIMMMTWQPSVGWAHPHVFAEARFDIVVNDAGMVQSLRHLWRFDELFSATVIFEFDKNNDLKLGDAELENVREVIYGSLNDFNYFQMVSVDDKDIGMIRPETFQVMMEDNQLIIFFESKPKEPLKLSGKVVFGVYDPTFYTAIDFVEDEYLAVENEPQTCSRQVIRPDPDEAIAENQETLTEAFFTDPTDMSKIFATRLELHCAK